MPKDTRGYRDRSNGVANYTRLEDPELLRAQTKLITTRRITGSSVGQIAAEFQLSQQTVNRRLEWAKRHGLIEAALDTVIDKLVPEALKTYLLAIQNGDVDAARDVMFGTGVLQKKPKTGIESSTSVEMTIESYRNNRKDRLDQASLPCLEAAPSIPLHHEVDGTFDFEGLTAGMDEDSHEDRGALDSAAPPDLPRPKAS